jgi:hypothetical protein
VYQTTKKILLLLMVVFVVSVFSVPHISVLSPTAGREYSVGDTLRFQWISLDTTVGGGCQIEISFDGGNEYFTIDDGTGHNPSDETWGTVVWVIPESLSTIDSRQKPVNLYTVSNTVKIQIIDFYNKIQETDYYPSANFVIKLESATEKFSIQYGLNTPFTISPNPSRSLLTIRGAMDGVSLYDLTGKLLMTDLSSNKHTINWSVGMLPAGAYIVKVKTGIDFYSKKITIQK